MQKAVEGGIFTSQGILSQSLLLPHYHRQTENATSGEPPRRAQRPPTHPGISTQPRGNTLARTEASRRAIAAPNDSGNGIPIRSTERGLAQSTPNGPPPPRPGAPLASSGSSSNKPPSSPPKPTTSARSDRFFIAIETKLRLEAPERGSNPIESRELLTNMAALHNREVNGRYPRMETRSVVETWWQKGSNYRRWTVMDDPLNDDRLSIQLRSPNIEVTNDPNWREQIRITWTFLYRNYVIKPDMNSHTFIHVSLARGGARPGGSIMDLQDIKKIAQCVIHFETALQVLIPQTRRGDHSAMSNWIDNDKFLEKAFSRRKAIEMIESCNSTREVVELTSPDKLLRPWTDQICFSWNFRTLSKYKSIEFRSAGTDLGSDTATAWAELVLLFVRAAIQISGPEFLRQIPANVGELKKFLGLDKLKNLKPIFDGKKDDESMQPEITRFQGTREQGKLQTRLKADEELVRRLAEGQMI